MAMIRRLSCLASISFCLKMQSLNVGVGVVIGVIIGMIIENLAMGIGIGIALGIALSLARKNDGPHRK